MRKPIAAVVVVSLLLVVLAAGAALAGHGGNPITCPGGPCFGTPGNDDISGSSIDDQIRAMGGVDWVDGFGGNDTINGGPGNDRVDGHDGDDTINTGLNDDRVDGFGGNDTINGEEGNDSAPDPLGGPPGLLGAEDSDIVRGDEGNDTVDLAAFDTIGSTDRGFGGEGNDTIKAQDSQTDLIDCGKGNDTAFRDPGLDTTKKCEVLIP